MVVKSIWLFAILAIHVWCLFHDQKMMPVVAAEDCDVDLRGLEIECMYYMHKGDQPPKLLDPNDRCCNVIKKANIPCCCRNFDRRLIFPPGAKFEDLLNWTKVLHCFKFCGRPFAPGTKCGSFTAPPGLPSKSELKAYDDVAPLQSNIHG